jgi:hypothetical protein
MNELIVKQQFNNEVEKCQFSGMEEGYEKGERGRDCNPCCIA